MKMKLLVGMICVFLAVIIINSLYDNAWLTIYRSQVLMLTELNRGLLRREQVKTYYDDAARSNPQLYANYSFDQWLGYLRGQVLLLEHPGQTFEITVRGKDFLKYMVHRGLTADARKF